jgi:23S rRNA U2552 (ribose-2'-O)-methylase RlmE/FtsJ
MKILSWKLFLEELVGEKPISDYLKYISDMNQTMPDKLFFIGDIKFDVIVDFGCADGTFLENVSKVRPNVKIIGYDIDQNMLDKASAKLPKRALLTDDWRTVVSEVSKYNRPLLNLSSVIHEVYSYSKNSMIINKFWNGQVFAGDFKWITIRDMIPSVTLTRNEIVDFKQDAKKLRRMADKESLQSFEENWGSINSDYRNFVHFLLKYKYRDNWEREVRENYLPITLETLRTKIPQGYSIVLEDSFVLPYLKKEVKKDFNIDLTHATHLKMIIENKNFR